MEQVLCYKCGQKNPAEGETCTACGHHLYVFCHCGARIVRTAFSCASCGDTLRRRIRRKRPQFDSLALGPSGARSSSGDLGAAVFMFAAVVIFFGAILLYPLIRDSEEPSREERQQEYQRQQDRQEFKEFERLRQQLEQEKREHAPWDKWINGK